MVIVPRLLGVALTGVERQRDVWCVASGDSAKLACRISASCACKDYQEAPGNRCEHCWAVALYRKAIQLEGELYDVLSKVSEKLAVVRQRRKWRWLPKRHCARR